MNRVMTARDCRRPSSNRKKNFARTERLQQIRLRQFALCLVLFFLFFAGKGAFPEKIAKIQGDILTFISRDVDFKGALTKLGESLSNSGSALGDLGTFCVEVFGPKTQPASAAHDDAPLSSEGAAQIKLQPLGMHTVPYTLQEYCKETGSAPIFSVIEPIKESTRPTNPPALLGPPEPAKTPPPAGPTQPPAKNEPTVPAAGTILLKADYDGEAPPQRYTMDHISLGALDTIAPAEGYLTSSYGYRTHPITGEHQFHGGIDIGCPEGDAIGAFASGTVEYTGEDDSYGKYMQLDHGNGIKSFYAHCSKITVRKGQAVAKGEKIAEVGSTGRSTGPHLHLELKYNKMNLNPAYYVKLAGQI